MDRKILLLVMVVIASGCLSNGNGPENGSSKGVVVENFEVSDSSLSPGQTAVITLKMKKYSQEPVDLEDVSLYNTGLIRTEKQGCSPPEFEDGTGDYNPGVECNWRISVPGDSSAFESQTIPVKLNLAYTSELSNSDNSIKIRFNPIEDIENTQTVQRSFSNGEVRVQVNTETPMPLEGRTMEVRVGNNGPGRVDGGFRMDYFPSGLLSGCPVEPGPVVEQGVTFTCEVEPESSSGSTRNLILSTSYKYVKAPTLDIEVVNRQ